MGHQGWGGETRLRYLVGVDLAFLAETWRHVLGLDLLLGHVVLVEEMLVLHLWHRQRR